MSSPGGRHTLSLFERRSVKKVEQWAAQFPEREAQLKEGEGPAQLEEGEGPLHCLEEEKPIVFTRLEMPVSSVSQGSPVRPVEQEQEKQVSPDAIEVSHIDTNLCSCGGTQAHYGGWGHTLISPSQPLLRLVIATIRTFHAENPTL